MDTWFLDVESFYSTEYSLTRMDPPSYILGNLFEAHCLGAARNTEKAFIVDGPDIPDFLHQVVTSSAAVVTHNALFDMCVFSWRFGFVPKLIIDTLAMSRTLLSCKLKSLSLRSVAKYLNLPEKGGFLAAARGMTRLDLIANGMWQQYCDYCINDVELCRMIYLELAPKLPDEEFLVHDMIARMAVEPCLRLNTTVLAEHLNAVRTEKEVMFAKAMLAGLDNKKQLMSNNQFAALLEEMGVDPPRKLSMATGQPTWAFSRQDVEFMELREHPDQRVQALVEARLGHKSTLEETRTERMLGIAALDFPSLGNTSGWMPIPLKVGAAITHRFGGDWQLNCQNWGRDSPIRKSVESPEGWCVVASDAAQVEARLTAWLSGQHDMVQAFAEGKDVYALFATTVFGYPVNKKEHPGPRFIGKTGVLQLGYQSGWKKFQATVLLLSAKEGEPISLSDEEAVRVVMTYRSVNAAIAAMWEHLAAMIAWMANAAADQFHKVGPITFTRWKVTGPNGLELYYENLQWDAGERQWTYTYHGATHRIFGGKLLENIIQFLARTIIMQCALRIKKRLHNVPVRFVHQAHDELIYLARDDVAEYVAQVLTEEMCLTPDWAPGLPLRGETKRGLSYGEMRVV